MSVTSMNYRRHSGIGIQPATLQSTGPVFTYTGPRSGPAYEAWREEFCRLFCRLDAEPTAEEQIECSVQATRVGPLSLGTAHGTSGSFMRTQNLLSDGCDDLVLVTASTGKILSVQGGHTNELQSSQMCLLALDHIGETALSNGSQYTALRMPRRDLLDIFPDAEDKLFKPLVVSPSMRDAVTGYFGLCTTTAPSLDAVAQNVMARHMTELVGLLLRSDADETPPALHSGYSAARLQMVQAEILRRLNQNDLTIGAVARRCNLSPKYIQRLFGASGTTFSEFVLEQRLLLARRMLSVNNGRPEKIAAIAQDAGFGDLSYFNRSFRSRFGTTPSDWREANAL
jgi:AraC-like DNA-binding protein